MILETVPQLASVLFGKTHKWLLVTQHDGELNWAANGAELEAGTQKTLDELFKQIQSGCAYWSLSALTEPALSEEECPKVLDFIFPSSGDRLSSAVLPEQVLSTLLTYTNKAARMIETSLQYRGFPTIKSDVQVLKLEHPINVCANGMLLCGERLEIHKSVATAGAPDKHLWYARALLELYPCAFYQRLIGGASNGFLHYVVASIDGMPGAEAVWDAELKELDSKAHSSGTLKDDRRLLYRVVAPVDKQYIDLTMENGASDARCSLDELGHKLLILSSRSRAMQYVVPVDCSGVELKGDLIQRHMHDALGPITARGWDSL